jgi:hypothetical protein
VCDVHGFRANGGGLRQLDLFDKIARVRATIVPDGVSLNGNFEASRKIVAWSPVTNAWSKFSDAA